MTGAAFDLVIFDCDGVLVDSERLAVRTEVAILAGLGWPLTEDEVVERFVGRSAAYMQAEVERALGRDVDWASEFDERYAAVFEAELEPIDGVAEALESLASLEVPVCVASSSSRDAIEYKLRRTGLWGYLDGAVFSVDDVAHCKPFPDVFVHAAATMGAEPGTCAVVEDSLPGIEAGLAARMSVFAYAGGLVDPAALVQPGVTVFVEMDRLPALLGAAPPAVA